MPSTAFRLVHSENRHSILSVVAKASAGPMVSFFVVASEKRNMKKGDQVKWKWGKGEAEGKVTDAAAKTVTKKIKGTEVKRKGSADNKALTINQHDGDTVLKLESQVKKK